MARRFAIERKTHGAVADLGDARRAFDPLYRFGHGSDRLHRFGAIGRCHRTLRKQVQDVSQQQFLMLCFMRAAQFDQIAGGVGESG